MGWFVNIILPLGLALIVLAADELDWRLDLLAEEGVSAETPALEKIDADLDFPAERLGQEVDKLASEDFATRERAQMEILQMGREALPGIRNMRGADNPEVRFRLAEIVREMQADGRWAKDDLLRRAAISLLEQRKNKAAPAPRLFAELFRQAAPSLKSGYRKFRFTADEGLDGSVSGGVLRLPGKHPTDLDQRLVIDAMALTGKPVFPDEFRVEAKLGGGAAGSGSYHVGIAVGNIRMLFHPGYSTGAFRIERVDDHKPIFQNTPMGFDPPDGKLLPMGIDVKRRPNGDVAVDVTVSSGEKTFRKSALLKAGLIGELGSISLDRSGRAGGDGLFDELVVDWGG